MMFKETKGLEYTLEILKVLHVNEGEHDSKAIYDLMTKDGDIKPSLSYVQKILPRMKKACLIDSSNIGYALNRPIEKITVDMILNICGAPTHSSATLELHSMVLKQLSNISVTEIYSFD